MFDTSNPAYFLFDVIQRYFSILSSVRFLGFSLQTWIFGFVATAIVASIFWKGARG